MSVPEPGTLVLHEPAGSGVVRAAAGPMSKASLGATLAMFLDVVVPTLGKGVLVRRPRIVALAERLGLDNRAVRRLQKLRTRYGPGPLLFPIPGRPQAVILAAEDAHRVLRREPESFAPASTEKRSALAHFEPRVSLASSGPERTERRRFHDDLLERGQILHSMTDRFAAVIQEEARRLLALPESVLTWSAFTGAWHRAVRRIVLGDKARDDRALTDMLARLRAAANWGFLHPRRKRLLRSFHERLAEHLARAEPASLAARIAAWPRSDATAPTDQVAHWLFAFDAGGIATFRTIALLVAHADAMVRARVESAAEAQRAGNDLPFLRACVLESVRLWPTTPAILRETTRDVPWLDGTMAKGTQVLIYVPFFHRDDETLAVAHRFAPDLWLTGQAAGDSPFIPFSEGPGACPAHNLVPALGSIMVRTIVDEGAPHWAGRYRLAPDQPLPGTLDPFTLHFRLGPA